MNDLEYIKMINDLLSKSLDKINTEEITKNINGDLYEKKKILNKIIDFLRIKRKELLVLKSNYLKTENIDELDEIYLNLKKINKCLSGINGELFKVKKQIKNINGKEVEENSNEVISEISQIMKLKNNLKQLIKLYSKSGYDVKQIISNINLKIGDLNKFFVNKKNNNKIKENHSEKAINLFFEQISKDLSKKNNQELKEFKCLILQIKQIYISNINLYNNLSIILKNDIIVSKKIIQKIDEVISQIKIQSGNNSLTEIVEANPSLNNHSYDLKNMLFYENDYDNLFQILNNNPDLCLTKVDEKFIFEAYLEYTKNKIINSNISDKEIHNIAKKILLFIEMIEKNKYLELKNIYNNYLYNLSKLIVKLDNKNFDLSKCKQIKLFLSLINLDKVKQNKENDFDRFIEIITDLKKEAHYDYYFDYIITIDNDEAKLLDTAYSFKQNKDESYEVGIYIKDIIDLLDELDINKIYNQFIRNKRIFDSDFALKKLSLSAIQPYHKVLGHHFKLDKNFQVKDFEIRKEMINVTSNLKYTDVMDTIKRNKDTKISKILRTFHKCGNNIIDVERRYSLYKVNGIDRLNHNMMLFFNYYMASFCKETNIPSIFLTDSYSSNYTINNTPYGKYSCPARNFTSLINQIIYGIYLNGDIDDYKTKKIIELLEIYAINLNNESHDSSLKSARKKILK